MSDGVATQMKEFVSGRRVSGSILAAIWYRLENRLEPLDFDSMGKVLPAYTN